MIRVLPMGWSHSVSITQWIRTDIIRKSFGLLQQDKILKGTDREVDTFRYGIHIEDFFYAGTWQGHNEEGIPSNPGRVVATRFLDRVNIVCDPMQKPVNFWRLQYVKDVLRLILGIEEPHIRENAFIAPEEAA